MSTLQNRINRMFNDTVFSTENDVDDYYLSKWHPAVDIFDNKDHIVIKAEIPGMDKKDIEIDVKDRILTLKGERSFEDEVKEDNYYRKERSYGKFYRAFTLPMDVNTDQIKADYKDGVLKIDIPKPEEKKPKQITIH
jgi:HSP20 family protein